MTICAIRMLRLSMAVACPTWASAALAQTPECCEPIAIPEVFDRCGDTRPAPLYEPDVNGCGPESSPTQTEAITFVARFGRADFVPACDDHDRCYGTCNRDKAACDVDFLDAMVNRCDDVWGAGVPRLQQDVVRLYECVTMAAIFFDAVDIRGAQPFRDGQIEACWCCDRCAELGVDAGDMDAGRDAGRSDAGPRDGGGSDAMPPVDTCGPTGSPSRFEFSGAGRSSDPFAWLPPEDLVYDTVTGLTWRRNPEVEMPGDDFPPCVYDVSQSIPRDMAYCCSQGVDSSGRATYPGCNWQGFKALCEGHGMRLATNEELLDFANNNGLCFDNWDSWSAATGEWTAAIVGRTGALVNSTNHSIPETSLIWRDSNHVRCVR